MNPSKPDGPNLKPTACPYCDEKLDTSSCIDLAGAVPKPGDFSICLYCGEPSKFNDQLQMVRLEGAELSCIMSDSAVQEHMLHIKAMKAAADPSGQQAYSDQLDKMSGAVVDWRVNHQDSNPSIQYNFQKGTGVIAALQDAIDHHFISVNADALSMFKELGWLDDVKTMPTVLMVRAVLEHTFEKEE